MMRLTTEVLAHLRLMMDEIVVSYPPHIHRIKPPFVVGTAFFPGGCGLWCGLDHFAPAPQLFPEYPVMFVAHNYSGADAFEALRAKGGEAGFWWRDIILPLLGAAGLDPAQAFFTNALMGLKHGESLGSMKATKEFNAECASFMREQIRIVQPSAIVAFGGEAYPRVRKVEPNAIRCLHPSARTFNPLVTRVQRLTAAGIALGAAIEKARLNAPRM